ncbi:hypothetical protein D3C76_975260 [compost metagenome]
MLAQQADLLGAGLTIGYGAGRVVLILHSVEQGDQLIDQFALTLPALFKLRQFRFALAALFIQLFKAGLMQTATGGFAQ